MIEFVFMLTHHDRTVDDPLSVYEELRGTGLRYIGFKDIGATPAELTRAVVRAASGPVIAAGSVAGVAQIEALAAAGAWGFTIGGAIFEGRLPGGPDVAAQVRAVLDMAAKA